MRIADTPSSCHAARTYPIRRTLVRRLLGAGCVSISIVQTQHIAIGAGSRNESVDKSLIGILQG
jgi:hypothetical protein